MGKVIVVGIGPGSYEDMTIRADRALRGQSDQPGPGQQDRPTEDEADRRQPDQLQAGDRQCLRDEGRPGGQPDAGEEDHQADLAQQGVDVLRQIPAERAGAVQ